MCSFVFAEGECQNKGKRNHKQSSKDPVTGADVHELNEVKLVFNNKAP